MITIEACGEHPDCSVHVCHDGDRWVWSSHHPTTVSDEARLPLVEGISADRDGETITWQAATPDEAAVLGWDAHTHRVTATLGAVLGLRDAADVAAACGIAVQDLEAEALGWAAAQG